MHEISLSDVSSLVGQELGTSKWITIDQAMINLFADATHDHQFIHVDPNRAAAESPFGGAIAHGFLTLALLSVMNFSGMPKFREQTMGINYGFDRVRFISPVRTGSRVHGRFVLSDCRLRRASILMTAYNVTVEIEYPYGQSRLVSLRN
ncbi:MaoC family dehydratase [Sinorhizobium meliloti]|nr:MaoC family dehydratase [Sinorhizobium meliloti]